MAWDALAKKHAHLIINMALGMEHRFLEVVCITRAKKFWTAHGNKAKNGAQIDVGQYTHCKDSSPDGMVGCLTTTIQNTAQAEKNEEEKFIQVSMMNSQIARN